MTHHSPSPSSLPVEEATDTALPTVHPRSLCPAPRCASWGRFRSLGQRLAPFVFLFSFVLAVLYTLSLQGEALYWGDLFLYFYPLYEYVQQSLRQGHIPLWNPFVLCGQPLIGNPQAGVFYPTTLLLLFLPVWLYFTVNAILHLTVAGVGTYLFLRPHCGDRLGALFGAMVYSGSGFVLARLQFPPMLQSIAYLPYLLLLIDRMVDRPRIWYATLFALTVSLAILAAHTQIAYMSFGCACLYALARLWRLRRHRARARRALLELMAAFVVGVVGAAVYLLPALQLFKLSTREQMTWWQANRFVLHPEQLINFLLPHYYGDPSRGDYWGAGNMWEPCVYVGLLPLLLSGYAICRARRRPFLLFFTLVALISLLLAMGRLGGLYWLAFYLVPGVSNFHDPARFAFLTTFALAALTAVGMRALRDRRLSSTARIGITALGALNLWWFGAHLNPTLSPSHLAYRPRCLDVFSLSDGERVYTCLRQQIWDRYLNYSDYGPESRQYVEELSDTFSPNIGMRYGVAEASGYEPVPIKAITEVDGLARMALERQSPHLPRLMALLGARYLLLPHSTRYAHPGLIPMKARGVSIYRVREPTPSAWLVRETIRIDGYLRGLAAIASPHFDPRVVAVVSGEGGVHAVRPEEPGTVRLLRSDGLRCEMEVDAGEAPAFLVWSTAYYPGWRVSIDDVETSPRRTNHAFMGVAVPPGTHRLLFTYRPFVVRMAVFMSLSTVALISAGLTYGWLVRAFRRSTPIGERF